jgi:carbon monoxide dehydrogenase subunit G
MKIEQEIDIPAPIDEVWSFLEDVPRVATCLPGANLTDVVDDTTYDGTVSVKVGPILVNYLGRLVIEDRDLATRTVRMKADGKDKKGAGAANAKIQAVLIETDASHTRLTVSSDVQLSGRIATLGRGVQDVAGKIFAEFATRMSAEISATPSATPAPAAAADAPPATYDTEDASPPPDLPVTDGASGPGPSRQVEPASEPDEPPPPVVPTATSDLPIPQDPPTPHPVAAKPLETQANAPIKVGGMFWSILADKIRRLFRRRDRADR